MMLSIASCNVSSASLYGRRTLKKGEGFVLTVSREVRERFPEVERCMRDLRGTLRVVGWRPGDRPGVPEERIHRFHRPGVGASPGPHDCLDQRTEPYETTRCNQFLPKEGRSSTPKNRSDPFILQQGERLPALGTGRLYHKVRFSIVSPPVEVGDLYTRIGLSCG